MQVKLTFADLHNEAGARVGVHPGTCGAWRTAVRSSNSPGSLPACRCAPRLTPTRWRRAACSGSDRVLFDCSCSPRAHRRTTVAVQIAVPVGLSSEGGLSTTQVFRFARRTFELGLTFFEAAPVRTSASTTPPELWDLMRLRHRFGEPAHAAPTAIWLCDSKPTLLLAYAEALKAAGPA